MVGFLFRPMIKLRANEYFQKLHDNTLINDLEGLLLCFKICKYIFNDQNVHLSYNWVSIGVEWGIDIFHHIYYRHALNLYQLFLSIFKKFWQLPVMQWAFNLSWILNVWRYSMQHDSCKNKGLCHCQCLRTAFRNYKIKARML